MAIKLWRSRYTRSVIFMTGIARLPLEDPFSWGPLNVGQVSGTEKPGGGTTPAETQLRVDSLNPGTVHPRFVQAAARTINRPWHLCL